MGVKVLIYRFPYGRSEDPAVTDWCIQTALLASKDKRIDHIDFPWVDNTPLDMCRNAACAHAIEEGADLIGMIDSDMQPDCEPQGQLFWNVAFNFWHERLEKGAGPCLIGAPYCGPPPEERVYVMHWREAAADDVDGNVQLCSYDRCYAAAATGIEQVPALPTGLLLIDTRALEKIEPPWFYYESTSALKIDKVSTEDVTMTRDTALADVPCFVTWDCWAGHWKRKLVRKPRPIDPVSIPLKFRRACQAQKH